MATCYSDGDGGEINVYVIGQRLLKDNDRQPPPALSTNGGRKPDVADRRPHVVGEATEPKRILAFLSGTGADAALRAYADYLSSLLQGQITFLPERSAADTSSLRQVTSGFDLLLYGGQEESVLERFLFGSAGRRIARKTSTTTLIAQRPRWPIQKILLVVRVEASEALAVDWAGHLAQLTEAQLTILPLAPSQPLLYGAGSHLQVGIESLLNPSTPSGEQLRCFLDQLGHWQVEGTLRVRQGDPLWQICWEIDEGKYDLVIISAEPHSRWRRWLFGELVGPLLSRVDRPLLIAGMGRLEPLHSDQERDN